MNYPPTLNIHEAADLMKVHSKTVLDIINSGAIPAAKVGRAYVMLSKDVLAYVENQIMTQTKERMRAITTSHQQAKIPVDWHSA